MRIYVAIPTLEDPELEDTLLEAVQNANNPSSLHIGVSFTTSKSYFKHITNKFRGYSCFSFKLCNVKKDIGVGIGRLNSYSMYDDEDYFLQIDSHTKFEKGWDTKLIGMHTQAILETNNEKTILTGYLGKYARDDKNVRYLVDGHSIPRYPLFIPGFVKSTSVPAWSDTNVDELPFKINTKFVPASKFNANFSFGNKLFASCTGLEPDVLFFEEEIVQTMNLLDSGFSLIFPNQDVPLTHLYIEEVKEKRVVLDDLFNFRVNLIERINLNYSSFISNPDNKYKTTLFHKYTGVHPKYGAAVTGKLPTSYRVD